jgi:hypothetical protein
MGGCCTNEARDKKVDAKEETLGQNANNEAIAERAGRHGEADNEGQGQVQENEFENNAANIKSTSDDVNVSYLRYVFRI